MDKKIIVGSKAFFNGMADFHSKDIDVLILTDEPNGFEHYQQRSMAGQCTFKWVRKSKEDFIAYAKREKAKGLEFGKFLVPEFVKEIDLSIGEFEALYGFYKSRLDAQHAYQKVIAEAYISNWDFSLTDAQREAAYKAYKAARKTEEDKGRDTEIEAKKAS